jgi:hypothetical protein
VRLEVREPKDSAQRGTKPTPHESGFKLSLQNDLHFVVDEHRAKAEE